MLKKRYLRRGLIVLTVLLLLFGAGWYVTGLAMVSVGYGVETEFESVPADDVALEEWIKTQPVVKSTVSVYRGFRGNRTRIEIIFIMSQSFRGTPAFPFDELDLQCERLGYRGASHPFRDSERTKP